MNTPDVVDAGAEAFGSQCIVVAIDAKSNDDSTWNVYTQIIVFADAYWQLEKAIRLGKLRLSTQPAAGLMTKRWSI